MDCPNCKLTNPEGTVSCECGYDFCRGSAEQPSARLRTPKQLAIVGLQRGLLMAGCAALGGLIWTFGGIFVACGLGWGGNLCGLAPLMTAPIGCVFGALWAIGILYLQSKSKFHASAKWFRVLVFAQWFIPACLCAAVMVAIFVGQAKYQQKANSGDAALFRVTALKIHGAELRYVREHGAFTSDGTALGLKELQWRSSALNGGEWETIAGGYTITLQKLISCVTGSCLLIAHPPEGGRICVTVDGRIIPDSDKTIREHITTTGEKPDGLKGCIPSIAH